MLCPVYLQHLFPRPLPVSVVLSQALCGEISALGLGRGKIRGAHDALDDIEAAVSRLTRDVPYSAVSHALGLAPTREAADFKFKISGGLARGLRVGPRGLHVWGSRFRI